MEYIGLEPITLSLQRICATIAPVPRGRDGRNRTYVSASQTQRDAILLHPVEVLYGVAVSTQHNTLFGFFFNVVETKTLTKHYRDFILFVIIGVMEVKGSIVIESATLARKSFLPVIILLTTFFLSRFFALRVARNTEMSFVGNSFNYSGIGEL